MTTKHPKKPPKILLKFKNFKKKHRKNLIFGVVNCRHRVQLLRNDQSKWNSKEKHHQKNEKQNQLQGLPIEPRELLHIDDND